MSEKASDMNEHLTATTCNSLSRKRFVSRKSRHQVTDKELQVNYSYFSLLYLLLFYSACMRSVFCVGLTYFIH